MIQDTSTQPPVAWSCNPLAFSPPTPLPTPSLPYKPLLHHYYIISPLAQVTELEWQVEMIQETSTQPPVAWSCNPVAFSRRSLPFPFPLPPSPLQALYTVTLFLSPHRLLN